MSSHEYTQKKNKQWQLTFSREVIKDSGIPTKKKKVMNNEFENENKYK